MGRLKKLTDEERATNKKAFRILYFERKRLETIKATNDTRRCAYCGKDHGINSFRNKNDLTPKLVCRSCILTYDFCDVVEKLAIKNEAGCILWPENDRTSDYYHALRRRLFSSEENKKEYLHMGCDSRCLNDAHVFRYRSGFPPLWYRLGVSKEFDINNPNEAEKELLKTYLKSKVSIDENSCWKSGDWLKDGTIRIGDTIFDSKKLFYEIFTGKIAQSKREQMIAHRCASINCVNPEHLELFVSKYHDIPFWARFGLKKPDDKFGYCQNEECMSFGVSLETKELHSFNLKNGRLFKIVCRECLDDENSLFKKIARISTRDTEQLGKLDREFVKNTIMKYKTCCYCNRGCDQIPYLANSIHKSKFQIEHIIPIMGSEQFGTNNNSNLELACWECNINKGNKSICNWRNKLEFWITKNKNINKLQFYKSILVNLSSSNAIVNDEFVARHMRNKINE